MYGNVSFQDTIAIYVRLFWMLACGKMNFKRAIFFECLSRLILLAELFCDFFWHERNVKTYFTFFWPKHSWKTCRKCWNVHQVSKNSFKNQDRQKYSRPTSTRQKNCPINFHWSKPTFKTEVHRKFCASVYFELLLCICYIHFTLFKSKHFLKICMPNSAEMWISMQNKKHFCTCAEKFLFCMLIHFFALFGVQNKNYIGHVQKSVLHSARKFTFPQA